MLKKIKVTILSTLVAIGSLGLVGCSKGGNKNVKDKMKVTLVLSEGGVNDQSFNQSAWEGAQKAGEELGVEVAYLESKSPVDYMQNVETAVDQGSDLVIGVGFQLGDTMKEAAENYPSQQFAVIDNSYEETLENLRSITFNEQQAGYAAGLVASKMTKSKKVGFVGGIDIPSCSNFSIGFKNAMEEELKGSETLIQFTNSFTDAAKGRVVAEKMVQQGVDIIFMASGGGNAGVLEVVRENNIKAIGVDMASNHLAPEHIITSALKNVGEGVRLTIKDLVDGNFTGGEVKYDLSNNGVGYENTKHLNDEIREFVDSKIDRLIVK